MRGESYMSNLKDFFQNNGRSVMALIVYVVGIFIVLSINFNYFKLTEKIILTLFATIIFVLTNMLFKKNKAK